jgi:HAD superfamily hydrolase (TIGR01509 family)
LTALRGVVFDLDGTLVDNMDLHAEAFSAFLERHRLPPFTTEMRARLDGQRNRDIFPIIFGRPLSEDDLRRFAGEKERLYREGSGGRLRPLGGLGTLLEQLAALGVPAAVATSAPAENVVHTLRELGLSERLSVVVRSDEVPRGKPAPDVFLAAARLIGADPTACLAFEDAPAGLRAARAAGMRCVAVTTSFTREAFAAHGADPDWAVRDFDEFLAGAGRTLLGAPVP